VTYFVIQWPDRQHHDRNGSILPSGMVAVEYAHRIIRELKKRAATTIPT
jgi:hypothetical protein